MKKLIKYAKLKQFAKTENFKNYLAKTEKAQVFVNLSEF